MTELELLNAIAAGSCTFSVETHPDFAEIDQLANRFEQSGYLVHVMKTITLRPNGPRLVRLEIIGGSTLAGDLRRAFLSAA